ncbi:MAG: patatin-like phospholipase family protein [Pseudomonadota bacterium]
MMKYFLIIFCFFIVGCAHPPVIRHDTPTSFTPKIKRNVRVALVLGSGGARSIAHLGVLHVLEKNNIPIDLIIGTSGGSIIGALYADCPHAGQLKKKIFACNKCDIINFSFASVIDGAQGILRSIIDGSNGERFLVKTLKAKNFSELKIPFVALATDVMTGETVILDKGPIPPAVRASYSIPGLFAPVELYGKTLVDGGVTAPLGTEVAKLYHPEIIIAVDVTLPTDQIKVINMLDLTYKCLNITYNTLNEALSRHADVLIKPQLGDAGIFDDHKRDMLYQAGVDAAMKALPEIKKKLSDK